MTFPTCLAAQLKFSARNPSVRQTWTSTSNALFLVVSFCHFHVADLGNLKLLVSHKSSFASTSVWSLNTNSFWIWAMFSSNATGAIVPQLRNTFAQLLIDVWLSTPCPPYESSNLTCLKLISWSNPIFREDINSLQIIYIHSMCICPIFWCTYLLYSLMLLYVESQNLTCPREPNSCPGLRERKQ